MGAIRLGAGDATVENINFSKEKKQIERYIAQQFVDYPPRDETKHFMAETLQQNPEYGPDFSVVTADGEKHLELMEFAPLNKFGGDFDKIPSRHNVGEMSDLYCQEVEKKSGKYQKVSNVYLVTYVTDRVLNLMGNLRLIKSKLNRSRLSLERVYYISLHGESGASSFRLYPVDGAVLSQAEEDRWRAMTGFSPRIADMRFEGNSVEIPMRPDRSNENGDN